MLIRKKKWTILENASLVLYVVCMMMNDDLYYLAHIQYNNFVILLHNVKENMIKVKWYIQYLPKAITNTEMSVPRSCILNFLRFQDLVQHTKFITLTFIHIQLPLVTLFDYVDSNYLGFIVFICYYQSNILYTTY